MLCAYLKSRGKHYLKCPNRHVAKDACVGSFISVARLEEIVAAELNRINAEYLDQDELAGDSSTAETWNRKNAARGGRYGLRKKLEECRRGLRGFIWIR